MPAPWVRSDLRDAKVVLHEGDASRALPAVDTRALLRRFESRRLPWARPWSLAVLGHWLGRQRLAS